jgi:hypothetical protein
MLIRLRDLKKLCKKAGNRGHRKEAINLLLPQSKHLKLHLLIIRKLLLNSRLPVPKKLMISRIK